MPQSFWKKLPGFETVNEGLAGLAYRSRCLGQDRGVVNIFGGNTSTKSIEKDHVGREVRVLWVKGSGSDIADITEKGFAGLRMDEVDPLFDRDTMTDEEMVAYLERCTFEPGRPRQSIETLLHAFVPATHVDHTHPDAVISIACASRGQEIMREIWGDRAAWVDYIRPGFDLSKQIGAAVRNNPNLECVVMGKHGLVTWGETQEECYASTMKIVGEAEAWLEKHRPSEPFGPRIYEPVSEERRQEVLASVLPILRGLAIGVRKDTDLEKDRSSLILRVDDSPEILEFTLRKTAATSSQYGAACPDHLVHTKRLPLWVEWNPASGVDALLASLETGMAGYKAEYETYFKAHAAPGDKMNSPQPRIILIPGLGMITTGADANGAEVSAELFLRAYEVMRNVPATGDFQPLSAAEAFGIEYWPLELYKLSLKPKPKALSGKVALITGAASGIGKATAFRLAEEGAHTVVADIRADVGEATVEELRRKFGRSRAIFVSCNVTDEAAVAEAYRETILAWGGVDIVVSNAGIAGSAPIEETTLEEWNRNHSILTTGYFLVSREAFRIWKQQQVGGNLIYVCSKNSVAAGKNAAAYSSAKAAELHLARCLAEEGGAHGIRVNSVLPDAVLSGSSIWSSSWKEERAATYGITIEELDDFYRKRTTLRQNVFPEDIAEAICFFACPASSKTTGGAITVDGGVPIAYVR